MSGAVQQPDAAALAQALVTARRHHALLPVGEWAQALASADDAYAVQDQVAAAFGWFGNAGPRYWKSGGASRDAVLTHAPLPPSGVRTSPATVSDWPLHTPAIEAEIALRLASDVDPALAASLTPDAVDELIDAMAVSIEVVDFRWLEGARTPSLLRLADQQSHGALVLGEWVPYARRDWSMQTCEVRIGLAPPVVRVGTHSLGDPAWLLPQWLQHATRHGSSVLKGAVVTTGTWVGVLSARRGDDVLVEFAGVGRASVQL